MPISSRSRKIIIGATSILVLLAILIAIVVFSVKSTGFRQNCPANVTKCSQGRLHYVETDQCFRRGEAPEGICGRNMVILPVYDCAIEGQCECAFESHNRTLVYHPGTNECYFVYTQAYCTEGHWLVPGNATGSFICDVDWCAKAKENEAKDKRDLIVPYGGQCHRLFSEDVPGCRGPLLFYKNRVKPSCTWKSASAVRTASVGDPGLPPCPAGSKRAVTDNCQVPDSIDWED